jgi:hypothetical protein
MANANMIILSQKSWLNPKIKIRKSPVGGQGMFALEKIEPGEDVLVFGEITLTKPKLKRKRKKDD